MANRRMLGLVLLLCAPRSLHAEPPTPIVVPDSGGRAFVPGETPPPADRRLPVERVPEAPPPAPQPPEVKPVPVVEKPPEPDKPLPAWVPTHAFELAVGPLWLPDRVFGWMSRFDKHPQLRGIAIDLAWWTPLARNRWLAARLGLGLPDVPTANWYESGRVASTDPADTKWRALYTRVGLVAIDAAADYVGHVPLTDSLDWTWRGGLGLVFLAGDVDLIETLPTCTTAERPTCPHWRTAGRSTASIPRVMPMVRATTGLSWRLGAHTAVGIEAGVRDVPWAGASAAVTY